MVQLWNSETPPWYNYGRRNPLHGTTMEEGNPSMVQLWKKEYPPWFPQIDVVPSLQKATLIKRRYNSV